MSTTSTRQRRTASVRRALRRCPTPGMTGVVVPGRTGPEVLVPGWAHDDTADVISALQAAGFSVPAPEILPHGTAAIRVDHPSWAALRMSA